MRSLNPSSGFLDLIGGHGNQDDRKKKCHLNDRFSDDK